MAEGLNPQMLQKFCPKCNREKEISAFNKNSSRHDSLSGWCKGCTNIYFRGKKYSNSRYKTKIGKYEHYRSSAKERNIEFNISFDYFSEFWQQDCYYCDGNIETIGLDRIDNNIGYIEGNVVSCCKVCNYGKGKLSIDEWNDYIKRLVNFRNNNIMIIKKYGNVSNNTQYGNYKRSAYRRGIEFSISLSEFISYKHLPCKYCGMISNIIGIDRKNNSIGYVKENLCSCCKICNRAKGDLEKNEWLKWIKRICSRNQDETTKQI